VASAIHADQKETAASYEAQAGVRQALFGNSTAAKQHAQAALAMSNGRDVQFLAGLAMLLAGDANGVQPLVNDFTKRFPEDTLAKFVHLPSLRAEQALVRRDWSKALAELQPSLPYESGQASSGNVFTIAFILFTPAQQLTCLPSKAKKRPSNTKNFSITAAWSSTTL
jgi:hypothetical protein